MDDLSPGDYNNATEAGGLLVSIVRTLATSCDPEQREEEKIRLEKAFKESDRKLDNMVADHLNDLTSIIIAFSEMSSRVMHSQGKIKTIKENLQSCKHLLHCKRDELRRLWIEGIKYKTVHDLMDEVEKIKNAGDKLRKHLESRHYMHYTSLLMSSLNTLEGDLSTVEGLKEIRNELIIKKEELYEILMGEINKVIYLKSTSSIVKRFQRQGSQRQNKNKSYLNADIKSSFLGDFDIGDDALKDIVCADTKVIASSSDPTIEDLNMVPDSNLVKFISILMESLALLKRLPDAVECIRSRLGSGLVAIVRRASQQVADSAYVEGEELSQMRQPQFLLDMLELVFKQFQIVSKVHEIILANLERIKNVLPAYGAFNSYDIMEIWSKIQSVLQTLLTHYLDIDEASTAKVTNSTHPSGAVDFSMYFAKKRQNKVTRKGSLFKFNKSSHAIEMDSYLREQRQEHYGSKEISSTPGVQGDSYPGRTTFVCKASPDNIKLIYNSLKKFLIDVEKSTKVNYTSLSLQLFVKEFVEGTFLPRVQNQIESIILLSARSPDLKRKLADQHYLRSLSIAKPILQTTITVAELLQDICSLMSSMSDYSPRFVNLICKALQDYLRVCQTSYRDCINPDVEEKKIISAMWVKDNDINRFLRSLPSWIDLKKVSTFEEEQPVLEVDLRAMNAKESTVLTNNLQQGSEAGVPLNEIISDSNQLKSLGNLCESMEWFSCRIDEFTSSLEIFQAAKFLYNGTDQLTPKGLLVNENVCYSVQSDTIVTLKSLAYHYKDLSELSLLFLHLEVRVHCFYHLLRIPMSDYCGAIDKLEPDENVIRLNKDLISFEEIISQSLQPLKFHYVFEGLGHLISNILVQSASKLKRINENGVKKMCRNVHAIQQCLSNITGNREPDLDHARQFYELLYLSPDEVMKACFERGKQFSEQEYTSLIQLNHRSSSSSTETDLQGRLSKLASILSDSN